MGRSRTSDDMVAAADVAMYDAKRRGGAQSVLYDEKRHGPR
jgi:predicted signal transduction protein with EAL and GGDEF domain